MGGGSDMRGLTLMLGMFTGPTTRGTPWGRGRPMLPGREPMAEATGRRTPFMDVRGFARMKMRLRGKMGAGASGFNEGGVLAVDAAVAGMLMIGYGCC